MKKLPESFGKLHSLQILDLSNNNLIELPESFCELQSLKSLWIENILIDNYISALSPSKKLQLKRMLKKLKILENAQHGTLHEKNQTRFIFSH